MKLNICHLYPDLLDLYGDRGNILTLAARLRWRGIESNIQRASLGDTLDFHSMDILFIGGGSDREQSLLVDDLMKRKSELNAAIHDGLVVLTICGGYQLLGQYYQTSGGEKIPGLGILDLWTVAGPKRLIGNVIVDLNQRAMVENFKTSEWATFNKNFLKKPKQKEALAQETMTKVKNSALIMEYSPPTLVGFENHSGKTYLGQGLISLGKVLQGQGNNGEDDNEGMRYLNVFGTYLHGPILPKNPHFADLLLRLALERRGNTEKFSKLDDHLEILAHQAVVKRFLPKS